MDKAQLQDVRDRVQDDLIKLCLNFRLPIPELLVSDTGAGYYKPGGPTHRRWDNKRAYVHYRKPEMARLSVGTRGHFGATHTLLHEFAHYLLHSRVEFRKGHGVHHDIAFTRALMDVVSFWYNGEIDRYCWDREYEIVKKYVVLLDD